MASSHCGPSKINFDKQYLEQCYKGRYKKTTNKLQTKCIICKQNWRISNKFKKNKDLEGHACFSAELRILDQRGRAEGQVNNKIEFLEPRDSQNRVCGRFKKICLSLEIVWVESICVKISNSWP
jgi:hypothetical protein